MPIITDKLVKGLTKPASGQRIIRDARSIGFGVRITSGGHIAFIFNYVMSGRERRMTIGHYPAWSVQAARDEAHRLRVQVDGGSDPLEEIATRRSAPTVAEYWSDYIETVLVRKSVSTQRNEQSMWRRFVLPELGRRRLPDVSYSNIETLHRRMSLKTPTQANRCVASLRKAFNVAIKRKLISLNPAVGISFNAENPVARYLDQSQRTAFVDALRRRPDTPSTLALLMLVATGARKGEVLNARWAHFDLEAAAWTKPSSHTKQRRLHRVPLSPLAAEALTRARALGLEGDLVFPAYSGKPLNDVRKIFRSICAEVGVEGLRIHDLRHTFASALVAERFGLQVVAQLLGHSQISTSNRYAHLDDALLREATSQVARSMAGSELKSVSGLRCDGER